MIGKAMKPCSFKGTGQKILPAVYFIQKGS